MLLLTHYVKSQQVYRGFIYWLIETGLSDKSLGKDSGIESFYSRFSILISYVLVKNNFCGFSGQISQSFGSTFVAVDRLQIKHKYTSCFVSENKARNYYQLLQESIKLRGCSDHQTEPLKFGIIGLQLNFFRYFDVALIENVVQFDE